jgi:hypothetical protein
MKIGLIVCPETSVNNYQYALRNNAEERKSLTHFLILHATCVSHPPLTMFIFSREKHLYIPYVLPSVRMFERCSHWTDFREF